jgi:hypothetical protein
MRLALSDTERALVSQWRALAEDLAPSAKTAWTRQGWIPRSVVDTAPDASSAAAPGPPGTPGAGDAIAIMESARLHEGAPEVMAAATLRRFLQTASGPATPGTPAPGPRPPRLIMPWWNDEQTPGRDTRADGGGAAHVSLALTRAGTQRRTGVTGTGTVLAGDGSADRAWLVAADPGTGPGSAGVVEIDFAPLPGRGGPGGYTVGREHPPYRCPVPGGTGTRVVRLLDAGQFAAFRDLARIAGACVLVGLIDTIFDAIVAAARQKASASEDRWAAQTDKHGAVDIAIRRDTAWLHLFRAVDSFGDPGSRAMFAGLALTEGAAGLGEAVAYRRGIALRGGDHDALTAADLAAAQRDFWLDLAGGTNALAEAVSLVQLGPPTAVGPSPGPG